MITRIFFSTFLIIASLQASAASEFDRMRCNRKIIFQGDSLAKVVENCGEPLNRRNWGNQYQTQNHLMFKAPGESGCYKTFFVNKRIQTSTYIGYGCR